jgi:hypothetical protein
MPLGNILTGADQQYVALKEETGTWRILNTWHEDLKQLDADDDIPDASESVTILSEGQFIALIKEAASLGVLENISFSNDNEEYESEIENLNIAIEDLKGELRKKDTVIETVTPHSEEYDIQVHAIDSIVKLMSVQSISKLSKD